MPSRRSHEKSRHGCYQCKNRKVKCDVQKPVCGNCHRRREECEFSRDTQSASPLPISPPSIGAVSLNLNLQDLELLHHFLTVVHITLAKEPKLHHMWQVSVPKEALSHPYLMHCILAVSAIHITTMSSHGNKVYREAAVRHQDAALSGFRPLLNNVTENNCHALCACSALTVIFAAGVRESPGTAGNASPLEKLLDICELTRGSYIIVQAAGQWIKNGAVSSLIQVKSWDNAPELRTDILSAIKDVEENIRLTAKSDEMIAIYSSALLTLNQTFEATAVNPDHPTIVFLWLILIQRRFVDLLRIKDHMALVLLAHYGVVLQASAEHWWCGDLGYQIVKMVSKLLDDDWKRRIEWPARMVELNK